jgi:uncharacterized protein
MSESDTHTSGTTRPCPICGKAASTEFWPFCSRRCADVDLYRWLSGGYAVAAAPEAEEAVPAAPETPKPEG